MDAPGSFVPAGGLRRPVLIVAALLILGAAGLAVLTLLPGEEDAWTRIRRSGSVRIGHTAEAPYAWRTPDGRVTGEAPELARAVFAQLGIQHIEWVEVQFGSLIPQLRTGRFDVIAAGMYVTPARERQIAFSHPSYCTHAALLVRHADAQRLRGYADLAQDPGARLAVLAGAVEGEAALAAGVPAGRIHAFPDAASAAQAVADGEADALTLSAPSVQWLADHDPRLRRAAEPVAAAPPDGCGAFGFRQEDRELRRRFDAQLRTFLGTPAHVALVRPFGFTPAELPPVQPMPPAQARRP